MFLLFFSLFDTSGCGIFSSNSAHSGFKTPVLILGLRLKFWKRSDQHFFIIQYLLFQFLLNTESHIKLKSLKRELIRNYLRICNQTFCSGLDFDKIYLRSLKLADLAIRPTLAFYSASYTFNSKRELPPGNPRSFASTFSPGPGICTI